MPRLTENISSLDLRNEKNRIRRGPRSRLRCAPQHAQDSIVLGAGSCVEVECPAPAPSNSPESTDSSAGLKREWGRARNSSVGRGLQNGVVAGLGLTHECAALPKGLSRALRQGLFPL